MRVPRFTASASICAIVAFGLGHAVTASAAAPDYGKIVSQSYNKTQMVTETHLANGLTILSKEVHAAPVVYYSVWYRVGSRNEVSGQTGLSHILEHMMFKGTKDLPAGAINHLFQTNGGQINAATNTDWTMYYEKIASDRLELSVRVEADRMRNSLFAPNELAHEMSVVRSELEGDNNNPIREMYDNVFMPTAFTAHPYHWPVIGWTTDVEAVANRRDIIYQYYQQHYMPNNAVVVMVGDLDTKKAVGLCQKYFGVYAPGKLPQNHVTPEPPQRGERRVSLKRPGTTGHVMIGYHAPVIGTTDHYVMDVIVFILSGGRSARLYQSLVEKGIAEEASAGNSDTKDPYLFELDATPRSGVTNEATEKALEDEIVNLQTNPVSASEIQDAVRQIAASFVYQNDSVSAQGNQIGTYEISLSYKYLDTYLDRIGKVTPADIQRVSKQYFTQDNRTVAFFEPQPLPPGQSTPPPAVADNFGASKPIKDPKQKALLAALDKKYNSQLAPTPTGKKPQPKRVVLPNGLTVIVQENHSNKTVALTGYVRAGSMYDPEGRYNTASLTEAMLSRGTATKSALQLARTLDALGAQVGFSANEEAVNFNGQCLSKDFPVTLTTLSDELRNPSFPAAELEKLRGQTLSGLEQAREDTGGTGGAGTQAQIAFSQALFPKGHPYWSPSIDDTEASVKAITRDDIVSFYQTHYRPDTTAIVIVGDVKADQAIAAVQSAFGDWAKPATPAPAFSIPDVALPAKAPAAQLIAIPDTPQTSILWGFPGQLTRNSKDFYAATILNYVLGGDTFGARLGKTIRDQNGLAYTVYSYFDARHGTGPFAIFVGTNPKNANRAISELRQITTQVRENGITSDELAQAKAFLTGSYPLRLETNSGIANQLLVAEDFGLGLDYIQKRASYYRAVTPAQVNAAAKKYLVPGKATLIIAGATPQ